MTSLFGEFSHLLKSFYSLASRGPSEADALMARFGYVYDDTYVWKPPSCPFWKATGSEASVFLPRRKIVPVPRCGKMRFTTLVLIWHVKMIAEFLVLKFALFNPTVREFTIKISNARLEGEQLQTHHLCKHAISPQQFGLTSLISPHVK